MGNLITFNGNEIGEVAKRRWRLMRRLLLVLLEYVNGAMDEEWRPGVVRNVTVSADGNLPPMPPPDTTPPPTGHFQFDLVFDDRSDQRDEIVLLDADELFRLFAWCDFLAARDGAFELVRPLVEALKVKTLAIPRNPGQV